jgi:hypothetical protein
MGTKAAGIFIAKLGDIRLHVHFNAPNNRSDRCNYYNRCKPFFDGIADALGINDSRFLPSMSFGENIPGGRVTIYVEGEEYDTRRAP